MKDMKATAIVTLLFAGVAVFFLQTLPGASQATPRAQAQAFPQHYDEVSVRLPAATIELVPGRGSLQLPVLDRTVRMSVTFTADNGEVAFGEVPAYCKSSTGECGFATMLGNQQTYAFFQLTSSELGIVVGGGPGGTLSLENYILSPGTLRVAFWY